MMSSDGTTEINSVPTSSFVYVPATVVIPTSWASSSAVVVPLSWVSSLSSS